jgi:hypothetical protein
MYGLVRSLESKKPFKFDEIPNISYGIYVDGVVAGIALSGVISGLKLDGGIISVSSLSPFTSEKILEWIDYQNPKVVGDDRKAIDAFFFV